MNATLQLRNKTKKFIDHADDRTVKIIHAMLEAELQNDCGMT